jgi:hypothetical protein
VARFDPERDAAANEVVDIGILGEGRCVRCLFKVKFFSVNYAEEETYRRSAGKKRPWEACKRVEIQIVDAFPEGINNALNYIDLAILFGATVSHSFWFKKQSANILSGLLLRQQCS